MIIFYRVGDESLFNRALYALIENELFPLDSENSSSFSERLQVVEEFFAQYNGSMNDEWEGIGILQGIYEYLQSPSMNGLYELVKGYHHELTFTCILGMVRELLNEFSLSNEQSMNVLSIIEIYQSAAYAKSSILMSIRIKLLRMT